MNWYAFARFNTALIILQLMSAGAAAQQVTFNLSWLPQGSLAGVIVAIELGYYDRGRSSATPGPFTSPTVESPSKPKWIPPATRDW